MTKFIAACMIWCMLLCFVGCGRQPAPGVEVSCARLPQPSDQEIVQFVDAAGENSDQSLLQAMINYPFRDIRDMGLVRHACCFVQKDIIESAIAHGEISPEAAQDIRRVCELIHALTAQPEGEGEHVYVVEFSDCDYTSVKWLRDETGLACPPGGAVVRLCRSTEDMSPVVSELFDAETAGLTIWSRFVVIRCGNLSRADLEKTISHELAHAYVCSLMGTHSRDLPEWFHEGLALHFGDAQGRMISWPGEGARISKPSPKPLDYVEYRLAFSYLADTLGEDGLADFVRNAVTNRSAEDALKSAAGFSNYDALLVEAKNHKGRRHLAYLAAAFGAAFVVALVWPRARRWIRYQRYLRETVYVVPGEKYYYYSSLDDAETTTVREAQNAGCEYDTLQSRNERELEYVARKLLDDETSAWEPVYVAPGEHHYHRSDCPTLRNKSNVVKAEKIAAVITGCRPCEYCCPEDSAALRSEDPAK